MKKTKAWKWILIIGVLLAISYQVERSLRKYSYPQTYEMDNFPLHAQPDNISCGPTCVQMVLDFYGQQVNLDEIRVHTKTDWYVKDEVEIGGTQPEYMKVALEKYGIKAKMMSANMETVRWLVSQNRPPIAMVRSGDTCWHWVVVIGYTQNNIIIANPGWGVREEMPAERFENAWNFTSDLSGTDLTIPCPVCGGDGRIGNIGPLGNCDVCGGTGKLPDWHWVLIELGEQRGYIIVVPEEPSDACSLPNQ